MPSFWDLLSGIPGMDETAGMPWYANLIVGLLNAIPELGLRSGYYRAPQMSSRADGASALVNEFQDVLQNARQGETVSDPRLNPEIQRQFPDWIIPQKYSLAELYQNLNPAVKEMLRGIFAAPGAEDMQVELRDLPPMTGQEALTQTFQTSPGDILYPARPVGVISPELMTERERSEDARQQVINLLASFGVTESPETLGEYKTTLGQSGMEQAFPMLYAPEKPEKAAKPTTDERHYAEYQEYLDLDEQIEGGLANPEDLARHKYLKSLPHIKRTLPKKEGMKPLTAKQLRDAAEAADARRDYAAGKRYRELADQLDLKAAAEIDQQLSMESLLPRLQQPGARLLPAPMGNESTEPSTEVQIPGFEQPTTAPLTVPAQMGIPSKLQAILGKYDSFDEWYDTLSANQKQKLTPEEERLVRAYYGSF